MKKYFQNKKGDIISTAIGKFYIESYLGKGKSGYSYLASQSNKRVVLKFIHNEPCAYYNFSEDKLKIELDAYKILKSNSMPVPNLLYYNEKSKYLIKEYIEGMTAADWISKGMQNDIVIANLFEISNRLKSNKLNIDYFPTNFVIRNNQLHYIDYEVNPYSDEWSLDNWGIYYWANTEGFNKFLLLGDVGSINQDIERGIPLKSPFENQVRIWKEKLSSAPL